MFSFARRPSSRVRRIFSRSSGLGFGILITSEKLNYDIQLSADGNHDHADSLEHLDHVVERCRTGVLCRHLGMVAARRAEGKMSLAA